MGKDLEDMDPTERFIVLENCGHILEVAALDRIMNVDVGSEIQPKVSDWPCIEFILANRLTFMSTIKILDVSSLSRSDLELSTVQQGNICKTADNFGF